MTAALEPVVRTEPYYIQIVVEAESGVCRGSPEVAGAAEQQAGKVQAIPISS
jgi:hypothetical protein